jgi:hypothetical protein
MKPGFKTVCRASLILGIGLLSGSALWSQQKKTLSPIEQVNALAKPDEVALFVWKAI